MKKGFYITTTLPYVNAEPHIGFAMEIIRADVLARFHRLIGDEVIFNTGTDEHGQKIYQKAIQEKKDPQKYCDENAALFSELKPLLNLSYTNFIRTTDKNHIAAAQYFWQLCQKKGDIYKAKYKINYCVGCELEKTESELVNDRCPIHPHLKLEIIEEENYFFRFSRYQKKLLKLYEKNNQFVIPEFRLEEIKNFVKSGLKDFSISRLKEKMPWGIEVPNDSHHVMYVWFDALINYISTLGWPKNPKKFNQFWPGIQIAGKDNLRQQSAMWQAMLLSAGLAPSKQIIVEGFITVEGQKMSKSLGNVIDPFNLIKKYGTDAVRYYLLKEIPPFEDGDFSYRRMKEIYSADLANELGNLVSRLINLASIDKISINNNQQLSINNHFFKLYDSFQFNIILEQIWQQIKSLNKEIDVFAPWKKTSSQRKDFLIKSIKRLKAIAFNLQPFLPETAEKILKTTCGKIKRISPLFPRLN